MSQATALGAWRCGTKLITTADTFSPLPTGSQPRSTLHKRHLLVPLEASVLVKSSQAPPSNFGCVVCSCNDSLRIVMWMAVNVSMTGFGIYQMFVRKNWFARPGSIPSLASTNCKALLALGMPTGIYWITANGVLAPFPGTSVVSAVWVWCECGVLWRGVV